VARVLLDANVLISAAIRPSGSPGRIIAMLFAQGAFDLVLSPAIVAEVKTALGLPKVRKYLREPAEALLWLADVAAIADLVEDSGAVRASLS
jgi:putative PIN family toxin of toxin-antitoxin system